MNVARILTRALSVLATLGIALSSEGATLEDVRVLGVCSNRFDYSLMSIVGKLDGRTRMAFNDLEGRTLIAAEGEKLGDYTLTGFEPKTVTVFDASVNRELTHKSGVAVLEGPDGENVRLECGIPLSRPGWLARVVNLKTGATRAVREGDDLAFSPVIGQIGSIQNGAVSVRAEGGQVTLSAVSSEERSQLAALWAPPPRPVAEPRKSRDRFEIAEPRRAPARRIRSHGTLVNLDFHPMEVTRLVGWDSCPVSVLSRDPVTGKNQVQVLNSIQMPRFSTMSYSGSIMVYAR